jgi:hypothetical protein
MVASAFPRFGNPMIPMPPVPHLRVSVSTLGPQVASNEWSQCITMETVSNDRVVGEAQPNPLFDLLNS